MKNYYVLVAAGLGAMAITLAGCADQSTSSNTPAREPLKTTHTQEDLQKTGRMDTGDALQAADPSVRSSGGR